MDARQILNPTPAPSANQKKAAVALVFAVAETIREVGEVPSGTLYTMLMDKISYTDFNHLLGILKGSGMVEDRDHLLVWVGPKL